MVSCNCGGKIIKAKKVAAKKVTPKKVAPKKNDGKTVSKRSAALSKKATALAKKNAKGCNCS